MASVVGLRVIRGPDWRGQDSDGGEGYLGTVVESLSNQEVRVLWDMGQETLCNAGLDGKFELRVFDSAQVGIHHPETCTNCGESGIFGMLWRCQGCSGSNLCSLCYNEDAHDLRHTFLRIDRPGADGIPVPKRKSSVKCRSLGIFPGSKVVRGNDWQWGDQDGGQGSEGEVKGYENVAPNSSRDLILVEWPNGASNSYRLGFRGNVDLKCVEEELGPSYYRDHLPMLDVSAFEKLTQQQDTNHSSAANEISPVHNGTPTEETAATAGPADTGELSIVEGDRVAIMVDVEQLRELQKDFGGCTSGMIKCIGMTGEVTKLSHRGSVHVHFGSSKVSYRFNVEALIKVLASWHEGDTVRIRANGELVKILNKRLSWDASMDSTLNKVGCITKVEESGDVEVDIDGHRYRFSPACCLSASTVDTEEKQAPNSACGIIAKGTNSEGTDTMIQEVASIAPGAPVKAEENNNLALFRKMRDKVLNDPSRIQGHHIDYVHQMLFQAVEEDDTAEIRNLCCQNPALVNETDVARGLTPLVYACLRGRRKSALTLLDLGADVNGCAKGDSKKTALSATMEGKDVTMCELLLERGAKTDDPVYGHGQTAVHLAVTRKQPYVLQLLAKHGANMNGLNVYGDTPLLQAIENMKQSTLETLISMPQVDMYTASRKGFNAIHLACYVDNPRALELLLERDRSHVDDGVIGRGMSAGIHIASANNHIDCLRLLVINGGANINRQDNKGMTALHIACHQGRLDTVETLLELGAEVNIADRDLDTPLHLAVGGKISGYGKGENADTKIASRIQISTMLISRGAYVDALDKKGKPPLNYGHQPVKQGVKRFMEHNKSAVKRMGTGKSYSFDSAFPGSMGSGNPAGNAQIGEVLKGVSLPCGVCGNSQSDITLQPCQHKCVCSGCSAGVTRCPLCTVEVKDKVNTGKGGESMDLQTVFKLLS